MLGSHGPAPIDQKQFLVGQLTGIIRDFKLDYFSFEHFFYLTFCVSPFGYMIRQALCFVNDIGLVFDKVL